MILFKLIQSIFNTLHSEGTPGQVAMGMALGAFLGLTPLASLHNLVIFVVICFCNVSFGGAMLGWAVFTPIGFILDPVFDSFGHRLLLDTPSLAPLWTAMYNAPVLPLTNFNNTVVLGSFVFTAIFFLPFFFFFRWGVDRYRDTAGAWLKQTKLYHVITASKLVNVYKLFFPVKVALVRWKAVLPIGVGLLVLVVGWVLLGNWLVKKVLEAGGTAAARARVEIEHVNVSLWQSRLTIYGLTVASPSEAYKNTLQAQELEADFETLPLLRKKFIVDRLAATGLRFGTPRTTDGRVKQPQADTGAAVPAATAPAPAAKPQTPSAKPSTIENLASRLNFPILNLAQGKLDVGTLDPSKLSTAAAARALQARADSASGAWTAALNDLHTGPTVDSAVALTSRLKGARPTDLTAISNARRMLTLLSQAKDKADALGRGIAAGAADLQHGVAALDSAKARDLATARGLVRLPALDASQIGAAVFGPAAAGKFEKALHWTRVAREYTPAGLAPHASPARKRVRRAGTDVRFPRENDLPAVWLKDGAVSFMLDSTRSYDGRLADLTTSQTLTGRPTTFRAQAPALQAGALLDHRRPEALDSVSGSVAVVRLPDLAIPVGGIRIEPGSGTMSFRFALEGENLRAGWEVRSAKITWVHDSAGGRSATGDLIWQIVSGISRLDVTAQLSGTPANPSLSVRSNLDQAISDRIKGLMGDQVKAAEQKLTAQVNAYADPLIAPVKSRVTSVTGDAQQQLGASQTRIADAKKQLDQRIKSLTGGLRLP